MKEIIDVVLKQMRDETKLYKNACNVISKFEKYKNKNLSSQKRKNQVRFYICWNEGNKRHREYMRKSRNDEVNSIKALKYAEQIKSNIEYNKKLNSNYVKRYRPITHGDVSAQLAPVYYSNCEEVLKLFYSDDAISWMREKEMYKKTFKPYKPEELKHKTVSGESTRSKSEMNIYNWLRYHDIPFVYELPLKLPDGTVLLPDFTIYISENRVIYIEHDGMYYDSWKQTDTNKKIGDYYRNGLIMGRDVLFTFDNCDKSLDMKSVTLQIQSFIKNQYLY